MPTAFAFDLAQLPEALRTHLRLWVEKTAARWAEEDSTLYFVRKKPTERRNIMRSLQTLAKSWEIELPTSSFLRDVDIVGKAEPMGNEPAVNESTGDDIEPESPPLVEERRSCPDLHRPLQNTAPTSTAPAVAKRYTPKVYRSLLPADYGEQVRRIIKAAA